MAAVVDGYLRTSFVIIYGHVVRNSSSMSLYSVDSAGFPSAACRYTICYAIAVLGMTCSASVVVVCCCFGAVFVLVGGRLIVHSEFVGVLVPWSTTFLSLMINMIDLSMKVVHPWSHSKLMESRAPEENTGKLCVFLNSGRSDGKRILHVCEDFIVVPSGNLTYNGVVVICLLIGRVLMGM